VCVCVCVCQILNVTANEQHNDAFHDIRLFSLFPAKSDMLWYDLRGIQLPWSVPRKYSHQRRTLTAIKLLHFTLIFAS